MTTTEIEYALDMRMRMARREVVTPLTGREVSLAVRNAADETAELRLDLSKMKRIVVDPRRRTARIQPGVSTQEIADAAAPHDLAPLVDHRGAVVAANLIAAQVVRPGGDLVQADEALLRDIRTGHAVGIVVDATYRLHPAGDVGR
jgi:FAD/FMN-containing dehydrogenase